jgi:hypothetical protein
MVTSLLLNIKDCFLDCTLDRANARSKCRDAVETAFCQDPADRAKAGQASTMFQQVAAPNVGTPELIRISVPSSCTV